MGCCRAISTTYVYALNVLLLVLSLAVLIHSAILTSELADYGDAINEGSIVAPVVFAAFMFLVSVVGLCAVKNDNKILLIVYLIAASVITFAVLVSGAVLISLSDTLDSATDARVLDAADSIEAQFVDFGLAVFGVCCEAPFDLDAPVPCADNIDVNCVSDVVRFEDFEQDIPEELCELLADVDFNGAPIVGDPVVNNGCANGEASDFVGQVLDFISDNLEPLGIANLVLSIIMLLDIVLTCVILWTNKSESSDEEGEEEPKNEFNEQAGPDIAQGGEVKY